MFFIKKTVWFQLLLNLSIVATTCDCRLWTYVTERGAGLRHTKRMGQNIAYHQTRVYLVFFSPHLLAKNYKREYGEFSNYKHGKSISTIRKTQEGECVLDTNIRFIPSFCFMTLSMTLSCLIQLLVIFSKSCKFQ